MVAHGGTSVAGSFIQTLTMVDVATGWTECLPLVRRDGNLVVEAIKRAQSLFPWLLRGVDFDNDSAFMNEVVVPWCRDQKLEVTRSRAYKKNDQAFVEQKNGAVVRRLIGYGRFDGVETACVMARLYAAARLYVNFFQPSFKLAEKRREGAKVIKRYHDPSTPYERALAHQEVLKTVKRRLREQYRTLDPVALLAEIRAAQEELGNRVDRRGVNGALTLPAVSPLPDAGNFAKALGKAKAAEPRATHRKAKRRYKKRVRMPSKLDPHLATIESWLAAEPQLTALAIVGRLTERDPEEEAYFGADGQPMLRKDWIVARWTNRHDERGNRIETAFFGLDGQPAINRSSGAARFTQGYDERGNLIEEAYFGADGKPIPHKQTALARRTWRYDERGNRIEETYFGVDGRPTLHKEHRAARITVAHDARGNVIEEAYFGAPGSAGSARRLARQPGDVAP